MFATLPIIHMSPVDERYSFTWGSKEAPPH